MKSSGFVAGMLAILVLTVAVASLEAANVNIVASSTDGTAPQQFFIPLDTGDKIITKDLFDLTGQASFELRDPNNNNLIGTLNALVVSYNLDPVVQVAFGFKAGAADTTFSISSGVLDLIPTIRDPRAEGQAGGTLDINNTSPATVTGNFNDKALQARYNGASVFADLLDPLAVSGTTGDIVKSGTDQFPQPAGTFAAIAGNVNSMELVFNMDITGGALVTGSGSFEVIPEPASWLLLAFGSLMILRRRR